MIKIPRHMLKLSNYIPTFVKCCSINEKINQILYNQRKSYKDVNRTLRFYLRGPGANDFTEIPSRSEQFLDDTQLLKDFRVIL